MAQRKTLTDAQLDVLRWIGDGCPQGVMPDGDYSHRISAAALQRRGLAGTAGRGPTWSAEITAAGREYIARVDGPDPPIPRQANGSVTQQLVDEVVAAGGRLRLRTDAYGKADGVDYRRRAELAQRTGRVPAGKRLVVERQSAEEIVVALVDAAEGAPAEARPVPVPERVGRYHPLVRRFRDETDRHEVSRAALPRMLRILHGLTVEAERRGHSVSEAMPEAGHQGRSRWSGKRDGHLVISAGEDAARLRISEEGLPSRAHWEQKTRTYDRWAQEWKSAPRTDYEANATGRLQIELVSGHSSRTSQWADRKSWTLEEKLPEVLWEIETRAAEAAERRREAERRTAEEKLEWQAALERAKARWAEAKRGEALEGEAARWRRAEDIRRYCDAAERSHPGDIETRAWVEWGRAYAASLDPLASAPHPPAVLEQIPPEELRPFLEDWDPYGPTRRRW